MLTLDDQLKSERIKYIPFSVKLEITKKCNLQCIHCCVDRINAEEVSGNDFEKFLKEAASLGSLALSIGGGEPLIRKDFFSIVERARSLDFAVSFFTNATLINSFIASQLKILKVYIVYVSIYGSTAKIHDAITGKCGSFDLLWQGVDYLLRAGLAPRLTTVVMKGNYDDLEDLIKLVRDRVGSEPLLSPTISPSYKGNKSPLKQRISKKHLLKFYSVHRGHECFQDFSNLNRGISCKAATTGCFISAQGDVYACPILRIKAGNIKHEAFNKIWHSDIFNHLRSLSIKDFGVCKDCGLLSRCARCPGLSFLEYKDYTLSNPQVCIKTSALYDLKKRKTKHKEAYHVG